MTTKIEPRTLPPELVSELGAIYDERIADTRSVKPHPWAELWPTLQKQASQVQNTGEILGQLTDDELRRWARAQALVGRAEALQRAASEAAARAQTETSMLFYDFSDRVGILETVQSAIDPAAGVMRRAVPRPGGQG